VGQLSEADEAIEKYRSQIVEEPDVEDVEDQDWTIEEIFEDLWQLMLEPRGVIALF
jgi:tetrahydromethanopterin S-methyltransferase subunit A